MEFYVRHWGDLFVGYGVNNKNLQPKIQKIVDDRNKFYQFKHDIEVDKNQSCDAMNKITKSYLQKHYPKISFLKSDSEKFEFEVNSFVNELFYLWLNRTFVIQSFVLDED